MAVTPLTLYPVNAAPSNGWAQGRKLVTATGGTGLSTAVFQSVGTATGWGRFYWDIGNSAWDNLPAPDHAPFGNYRGWRLDSTLLEGKTIQAGQWVWRWHERYSVKSSDALICRWRVYKYRRATDDIEWVFDSNDISLNVSNSDATVAMGRFDCPAVSFGPGEQLYMDLWAKESVAQNNRQTLYSQVSSSTTLGYALNVEVITPGYDTTVTGPTYHDGQVVASGSGSSSLSGLRVRLGGMTPSGGGSSSFTGRLVRDSAVVALGGGDASLAAQRVRAGGLTAAGAGEATLSGSLIRQAALAASGGAGGARLAASLLLMGAIRAAGGGSASFDAVTKGFTEALITASGGGSSTADAQLVLPARLAADGGGAATLAGALLREATIAAAGGGLVQLSGVRVRDGRLVADSSGAAFLSGLLLRDALIAAESSSDSTALAEAIRTALIEAAGGGEATPLVALVLSSSSRNPRALSVLLLDTLTGQAALLDGFPVALAAQLASLTADPQLKDGLTASAMQQSAGPSARGETET